MKKIVGIFVSMLLLATVLPVAGTINAEDIARGKETNVNDACGCNDRVASNQTITIRGFIYHVEVSLCMCGENARLTDSQGSTVAWLVLSLADFIRYLRRPGVYVEVIGYQTYCLDCFVIAVESISDVTPDPACADVNFDGNIDVADVVYLINYLFQGGPEPFGGVCIGDANGDAQVTIADAVYLINYIFKSGPAPVDNCCG